MEAFDEFVDYLNSLDPDEVLNNDAVGNEALARVMTWGFGGKVKVTIRCLVPSCLRRPLPVEERVP